MKEENHACPAVAHGGAATLKPLGGKGNFENHGKAKDNQETQQKVAGQNFGNKIDFGKFDHKNRLLYGKKSTMEKEKIFGCVHLMHKSDHIAPALELGSDCPSINNWEYGVWIGSPQSVRERGRKFVTWMGLNPDRLGGNSVDVYDDEDLSIRASLSAACFKFAANLFNLSSKFFVKPLSVIAPQSELTIPGGGDNAISLVAPPLRMHLRGKHISECLLKILEIEDDA
ncbi:unnamed protein product [Fraxinus pennsylvanica]|uniref:Uncharacterized protein n=1 Tax=Fraxinus pennsylvanica TaxID=56036 RepID=A0AAD2A082_9LAMI|nr:unnamed protein product [Fraxinus pennsylvanica]